MQVPSVERQMKNGNSIARISTTIFELLCQRLFVCREMNDFSRSLAQTLSPAPLIISSGTENILCADTHTRTRCQQKLFVAKLLSFDIIFHHLFRPNYTCLSFSISIATSTSFIQSFSLSPSLSPSFFYPRIPSEQKFI